MLATSVLWVSARIEDKGSHSGRDYREAIISDNGYKDSVDMRIDEQVREEGIEIPFREIDIRMRSGELPRS
jgi:small-conductance mechanosensitive channel